MDLLGVPCVWIPRPGLHPATRQGKLEQSPRLEGMKEFPCFITPSHVIREQSARKPTRINM